MKKYFIHLFVFSVIFGVLLSNCLENNLNKLSFALFLFGFLIIVSILLFNLSKNFRQILFIILIFIFSLALTLFRVKQTIITPLIPQFSEKQIEIVGTIVGEVDVRSFNTRLIIRIEEIKNEKNISRPDTNQFFNDSEKIISVIKHFPRYQTGDQIRLYGKVQLPQNFENDNGIEFDYAGYLAKDKIYSITYYPKIELLNRPNFNFQREIFKLKENFLAKVQAILPSPASELLGGILLGTKRSLGENLEEKFRKVGLIHIVVLSGYNVTIIAEFIFRLLTFLPKFFSAIIGAIAIIIFSIMVGSGATVIRSVIMSLLALISRVSNRNYNVNRALFLAGALMVLHNPQILLHDPSFQLSFLATIGLINLSDLIKKVFKFLPEKFQIREITSATFSTQIAVLPLLTKMTGELSLVAPIVNIITLQIIPITMLLGFITGCIAFFNQTLAIVIGLIPHLLLSYILLIVNFFSSFQFATIKLVF